MSESNAKQVRKPELLGSDGKPIKSVTLPIVKFRDFTFAMQVLQKSDITKAKNGEVRPQQLIHEYRARCRELDDRCQLLMAILCVTIDQGLEAGREFLDSVGAVVTDIDNKVLYKSKD